MLRFPRKPPLLSNYAYGSFTASGPVTALGSALKAWWDADDHGTARMTDDGSGVISAWVDKVGAMSVTAATTARPTWTVGALTSPTGNAKSGLTFDGTANCMVSTDLSTLPTGTTAGSLWAVSSQDFVAGARTSVSCGAGVTRRLFINNGGLNINDGTTSALGPTGNYFQPRIAMGRWSGTSESGRQDGVEVSAATITSINSDTARFRIGASAAAGAANFHVGVIRHIMVTSILTALQEMQLEAWLAWDIGWHRYRLPSTHPFRNRRP